MGSREGIQVGRPDTNVTSPAHEPGVREGNQPGAYESMPGHLPDGTSTAKRSTGISPGHHDPIDPKMPNLSPA